jgi:hypothetical protein
MPENTIVIACGKDKNLNAVLQQDTSLTVYISLMYQNGNPPYQLT